MPEMMFRVIIREKIDCILQKCKLMTTLFPTNLYALNNIRKKNNNKVTLNKTVFIPQKQFFQTLLPKYRIWTNRKIVNKELDTDRGRYQFKVNNTWSYRIQNFPNILLLFTAKSHTISLARLLENHLKYVTIKRRTTLTRAVYTFWKGLLTSI